MNRTLTKIAAAATLALTVAGLAPAVSSAQITLPPAPSRIIQGAPADSISCDTTPGSKTLYSNGFYADARYAKPTTFPFLQRGATIKLRACLSLQHEGAQQDADIFLERQLLAKDPDTPWETIKTTTGSDIYWLSNVKYNYLNWRGMDATVQYEPSKYRYQWKLYQRRGQGWYKFMIVQR